MKGFTTLVWLEYRRSWVWGAALIGSLAFWAWGLNQVNVRDIGEQLGIRAGLLGIATALGGLVLCFMIGRIRSETRQGQYQILLLTPPAGYVHIAARYVFALAVAVLYFVGIGGLAWWILAQTGLSLDAGTAAQLVLVCPFYAIGAVLIPLLSWTLLLMIFVSAYRISGSGWIPGTVMMLGSPLVMRWYGDWLIDISYTLPGWRLFEGVRTLIANTSWGAEVDTSGVTALVVPQEPLWGMLLLALVMLVIAGRIWQEVEG